MALRSSRVSTTLSTLVCLLFCLGYAAALGRAPLTTPTGAASVRPPGLPLRRTVVAALALAPAVALLAPTPSASTSTASAAELPRVGGDASPLANGDSLRWCDEPPDRGLFAEVLRTYNLAFVAYLARFLLNYDPPAQRWWASKLAGLPANLAPDAQRASQLALFAEFAASTQYGLRSYADARGVGELFDTLVRVHGAFPERRRHLALAFTFLEASQPRERIAGLLRAGDGRPLEPPPYGAAPFSPGLPDYLSRDPLYLLPPTQVPVWDVNVRRYVVRGLAELQRYGAYVQGGYSSADSRGGARGSELSVFGPRATFQVQRERALTASDFGLFALSGMAGCCTTHVLVTPLDVVKTRMQTSPGAYAGLVEGARAIAREEGVAMLYAGVQATMVGYGWYGLCVYPAFEYFSRAFEAAAGAQAAASLHAPIVLGAGACATVLACVGVCPMEAARIRAVAQPGFAPNLLATLARIEREEGLGSLYRGFVPVVLRQVVFGSVKFYSFDALTDALFELAPALKATVELQLCVSLVAGLAAGVASAIVSQPADAILSEVNRLGRRTAGGAGGVGAAAAALWAADGGGGPRRFFAGLSSRCLWSGSIISGQFFVYEIARTLFGITDDDLQLFLDVQFKDMQL